MRLGSHVRDRLGFLAGRDADRVADLNAALGDSEVRAVVALLGGCGSLRLVGEVDVRALGGLPIGHGGNPRSVPMGVPAVLDADRGVLTAAPALG